MRIAMRPMRVDLIDWHYWGGGICLPLDSYQQHMELREAEAE